MKIQNMTQRTQLLFLDNTMNIPIDILIMEFVNNLKNYSIAININHLTSIKLCKSKYDIINTHYYEITLTTGKKIYVNKFILTKYNFIKCPTDYTFNNDFTKIENLCNLYKSTIHIL
jgi:hypothetical protein